MLKNYISHISLLFTCLKETHGNKKQYILHIVHDTQIIILCSTYRQYIKICLFFY